MIHWSGQGYLAPVVLISAALVTITVEKYVFHNNHAKHLTTSCYLFFAAFILQYLVYRFPKLRMRMEQSYQEKTPQMSEVGEVQSISNKFMLFLKAKRNAPHTFIWIPLSIWPFILLAIGLAELFSISSRIRI